MISCGPIVISGTISLVLVYSIIMQLNNVPYFPPFLSQGHWLLQSGQKVNQPIHPQQLRCQPASMFVGSGGLRVYCFLDASRLVQVTGLGCGVNLFLASIFLFHHYYFGGMT